METVSAYPNQLNTQSGEVKENSSVYFRLIALWVLNEAMLGGIIHGFKIPVSGLVVGSCAIICICLIAWYVPKKGAILKATIIVAIFKMMLSPQAPPPAYIAVFFQGLLGELLFWNRKFFKLSCILLAVLGLLESGLQRILMLTIVYGSDLWKAINSFINGLTKQKEVTNYSLLIGSAYVILHIIVGIFTGWIASVLPARVENWSGKKENHIRIAGEGLFPLPDREKKKKRRRIGLLIVWIALILLYVQSYYKIGTPLLPSHISLKILLRSLIIILAWVFIVGPLLKQLLHFWLQKKRTAAQYEIQQVLALLPATQELIAKSWKKAKNEEGWKRIKLSIKLILVNSLSPQSEEPAKLYILTAPVQTGKTTSLLKWSENRKDVYGILTPVIDGKRMFMDAHTRELFQMEAGEDEKDVLSVGRYTFSRKGFERAVRVIKESRDKDGWLIIDEIGPVELRGEGFSRVTREILENRNPGQKLVLVVREGLAVKVIDFFQVHAIMLNSWDKMG